MRAFLGKKRKMLEGDDPIVKMTYKEFLEEVDPPYYEIYEDDIISEYRGYRIARINLRDYDNFPVFFVDSFRKRGVTSGCVVLYVPGEYWNIIDLDPRKRRFICYIVVGDDNYPAISRVFLTQEEAKRAIDLRIKR